MKVVLDSKETLLLVPKIKSRLEVSGNE